MVQQCMMSYILRTTQAATWYKRTGKASAHSDVKKKYTEVRHSTEDEDFNCHTSFCQSPDR